MTNSTPGLTAKRNLLYGMKIRLGRARREGNEDLAARLVGQIRELEAEIAEMEKHDA